MTNLEIIKLLKDSTFTDENGENYQLEFQDGLTDSEIENLKGRFPNSTIDHELIEILQETKGWDGYGPEMIYFDSIGEFGFLELSAHSITLGHDGFGNHWVLDLDNEGTPGKVFYACHDPAVFLIYSQNLNEYLNHLLDFYKNPSESYLDEIHDKTVMEIWRNNHLCSAKNEFVNRNPEYREFLTKFEGEEWTLADLRNGQNKNGFAWGKFGSNQYTVRHPFDLIWVMKNKKKSLLSRLFEK